ncbi:Aim46 protein [Saccharomycopsis crataegensis]|uniref:Altered inheritance of mitochondria protein 18, mitochondrial n=1 Tax=Saccharomycopsis crataegensis TaxID=43959 RepID=A0AAV5QNQ2_9ASCO|nr:Aim46 protein [Saccharomycopsis crataegensis]
MFTKTFLRNASSGINRGFHTYSFKSMPSVARKPAFLTGFIGASITTFAAYESFKYYWPHSTYVSLESPVYSSSISNLEDTIVVDKSINSFPTTLVSPEDGQTKFSLIGYGNRKVTFLQFSVYGLGIYIANEDVAKIPEVLNSKYLSEVFIDKHDPSLSHADNLALALKDPETSEVLINNLLDANIRFLIRIVPLRDTDFNHLRDGFVKSCVRNRLVKSSAPDNLNSGIDEIRVIFKKYRSKCPKNHVFLVETDKEGKTSFIYENLGKHPEQKKVEEVVYLGTVQETVISKALLLNYFAGAKPISNDARKKCIDEILRVV